MRIVYASDERYPHYEADTVVIARTTQALHAAGAEVELLIPRTWAGYAAGAEAQRARVRSTYGLSAEVPIRFLPAPPTTELRAQKLPHAVVTALSARARRPDVVISRNLPILGACKAAGLRVVMDHYRCHPHERPGWWGRLMPLWRRVDGLILHSALLQARWVQAGYPRARTTVAYTGYVEADLEPRLEGTEARRRIGLPEGAPVCVYTGNLGPHKGIGALLDLAAGVPQARFVLVGAHDAEERARLEATAAARELSNVQIVGFVPPVELLPYMYAADVLLIPPARAPMERHRRTALPLKAFTYLAAGRPILAPAMPDVEELLNERNALLVPADAPGPAAEALRALLADPRRRARLAAQGRADSARYTVQARAETILRFLPTLRGRAPLA